jgi:uncharacterized membrane protein YraQ (UPF0718 family)
VTTILKKYRAALLTLVVVSIGVLRSRDFGQSMTEITLLQLKEMLLVIPPVFILLGLLDVWVPRQILVRLMGEGSGIQGTVLAILLGSAAAGPLYGAFPAAAVFMNKGVSFRNILIFIGAWSTTKIPMLLFEISSLGARFALTRLTADIVGIIIIAALITAFTPKPYIQELYRKAAILSR